MEQRQIDVYDNRDEQIFIDKGSHKQIDQQNWEQTSGTTMDEQCKQTVHGIYANKVEEIVKQKEIGEQIIMSRQHCLTKHEDILDKNSTISIHLQNENEKINMKRIAEMQFSNKELGKILQVQSDTECLDTKFKQLNTLIQCCLRDQHQCDAANEKLQNEFNKLKIADEVKNQNYSRITGHFSNLSRSLQEEHIEKLKRYYSVLGDKEKEVQSTQENYIKLHYQEKDMIKTNNSLGNLNKKVSAEKDTLFQEFTSIKEEYEEYVKNVDDARNKALDEINELEQTSKENTEIIETLVCDNSNLEATGHNQAEYIEEMTTKNTELEKSINISNETCSALKNNIETIQLQMQENLAQYDEKLKSIAQEIMQYEEKNSVLEVENASLEQNTVNMEQVIEDLKVENEKHNNELIDMQNQLKESQTMLQDLISYSEEKIANLQSTVQEEEVKKNEEMKQIESFRQELQSVKDQFEKSEQDYGKLVKNALDKDKDLNARIAAMKDEVQKLQQSATREKERERENLRKKLDEKLAMKQKECDNHVTKYEEHIKRHQKETENVIMNEATKKAKELNNLSNSLRNMDLQIVENKTANQNLEEVVKQKVVVVEQLREKLAQMKKSVKTVNTNDSFDNLFKQDDLYTTQKNKENEIQDNEIYKTGYSSISISSISSQDDFRRKKRTGNAAKRATNKRSVVQTSTPKKPNPAKKLKSDELLSTLFDDPIIKRNKTIEKPGTRKSLF